MKYRKIKVMGGASAALVLAVSLLIMPWEGRRHVPYKDMGGVWSVCDGHTGADIKIGKTYSDAECDALTLKDARKAEQNVERGLKVPVSDMTKAAFISFEYNTGGFNRSTLLKRANAGDLIGACDQLRRWVYVNGRVVNGLMARRVLGDGERVSERDLCLRGLR